MKRIKAILTVLLIGFAFARFAASQQATLVAEGSNVWIEGRSNVSKFVCRAGELSGKGRLAGKDDPQVLLSVSVRSFNCGNPRMNSDLFETLKSDIYPTIHFEMDSANVVAYRSTGSVDLQVTGMITVAGVARSVRTRVVGDRLADGHLRAAGAIKLSMSDFSINPPTALLGLVRTRDEIIVRFDLVAAPASTGVSVLTQSRAN